MLNKSMRNTIFKIARRDLAQFLVDHEQELFQIFREELQRLDDELPEERLFIDIKVVPLGELIMKAVLNGLQRFLTGDLPEKIFEDSSDELAAILEE